MYSCIIYSEELWGLNINIRIPSYYYDLLVGTNILILENVDYCHFNTNGCDVHFTADL